jgi:hypothetical protein
MVVFGISDNDIELLSEVLDDGLCAVCWLGLVELGVELCKFAVQV